MQHTLFGSSELNVLPHDGEVFYFGKILNEEKASHFMKHLLQDIEWKNDEAYIFGKHFITKRMVAWYGDQPFSYTYSKATKFALPWTDELIEIKNLAESFTKSTYNSCLLNLYHNGNEGMAYHSDDELMLLKNGSIASLSFGAERRFLFKHKRDATSLGILLENGSLLEMKGETQSNWLHRLPTTRKVFTPRINLTFRTIVA
jgi:alkylated DNA repair dioxygenase AlkB